MEFENQKFVLVLGGSSFMGLTLLKKLSEEKNT
jgi:short-subunit dehydrogenase involved in D-alanine esterification of teichoic acids